MEGLIGCVLSTELGKVGRTGGGVRMANCRLSVPWS